MKKIFKILLLSVTLLGFAACNDDNNEDNKGKNEDNPPKTEEKYNFTGSLAVSNGYTQQDVEIRLEYVDSLSANILTFKEITFSDKMPYVQKVWIDFPAYTIENGDTVYTAAYKVPYWNNTPIESMALRNLRAVVSKDSLNFTAQGGGDSSEGSRDLLFKGVRKK